MSASPDELKKAASILGCSTDDFHSSAPIRLYFSPQGESSWGYCGFGIATVHFNTEEYYCLLKVVDIQKGTVLLEQETYEGFNMTKMSESFYSYEIDSGVIGYCFADGFDAFAFYKKVCGIVALSKQAAASAKPKTAPTSAPAPVKAAPVKKEEKKEEKKGGFLGLFGKKESKTADKPRPKIGQPKNFVHVAHLGYNKDGFGEIPDEWKNVFRMAGVSEDELKDKKTAKFLMKTIATAKRAPPPPPSKSGGAPPPPPPSGNTPPPPPPPTAKGSSAPPPPPPPTSAAGAPPPPPPPMPVTESASSGGSMDMLSLIKQTKLKTVKAEDFDISAMDQTEKTDLATNIQRAMAARRAAVEDDDDDADEDDDDWEL